MLKFSFKIFGCLTVFFFFTSVAVYLAITTRLPVVRVDPGMYDTIYPLARENAKIGFNRTFNNPQSAALESQFRFSDIEANAFVYDYIGSRQNFPIKEPYINFMEDTIRVRFDLSLDDLWPVISRVMRGETLTESMKSVMDEKPKTDKAPLGHTVRVSVTIDLGVEWDRDHPVFMIRKAYIGVLPMPFLSSLDRIFDETVAKARQGMQSYSKGGYYIKNMKISDKMLTIDVEAKATTDFLKRVEIAKRKKENPELFRFFDRDSRTCKLACSPEEEAKIMDFMKSLSLKGTLTDSDKARANQVLNEVTKKQAEENNSQAK